MLLTELENPYWDAVKEHIQPSYRATWHPDCADMLEVNPYPRGDGPRRHDYVSTYAWTIPDPDSVQFVLAHCGERVIDPLAGSGYWAWLLRSAGIRVDASDLKPPNLGGNGWHPGAYVWTNVGQADARTLPWDDITDRTLLLSWPPYGADLGEQVARSFRGQRLIYIGESEGASCGTDEMFDYFDEAFNLAAERTPVQWSGMYDEIRIYDRKDSDAAE